MDASAETQPGAPDAPSADQTDAARSDTAHAAGAARVADAGVARVADAGAACAADAAAPLADSLRRRHGGAPGVVGLASAADPVRRFGEWGARRLPLLAEVSGRWMPTRADRSQSPALLYVEGRTVEGSDPPGDLTAGAPASYEAALPTSLGGRPGMGPAPDLIEAQRSAVHAGSGGGNQVERVHDPSSRSKVMPGGAAGLTDAPPRIVRGQAPAQPLRSPAKSLSKRPAEAAPMPPDTGAEPVQELFGSAPRPCRQSIPF